MSIPEQIVLRNHALDCDNFADAMSKLMQDIPDAGKRQQAKNYADQFRQRAVELRRQAAGERGAIHQGPG